MGLVHVRDVRQKSNALAIARHSDLNKAAKNVAAYPRKDEFSAVCAVAKVIKNRLKQISTHRSGLY